MSTRKFKIDGSKYNIRRGNIVAYILVFCKHSTVSHAYCAIKTKYTTFCRATQQPLTRSVRDSQRLG